MYVELMTELAQLTLKYYCYTEVACDPPGDFS
jgi:hypothetical protein